MSTNKVIFITLIGMGLGIWVLIKVSTGAFNSSDLENVVIWGLSGLFGVFLAWVFGSNRIVDMEGNEIESKETDNTSDLNDKKIEDTELIKRVKANDIDGIKELLDSGVDINEQDNHGATALIYAVLSTNKEIVKLLVDKGADIKIKTKKQITAESIAVNNNLTEIMKILD